MRYFWIAFVIVLLLLNSGCASQQKANSKEFKVVLIGDSTVTDLAGWGGAFADGFNEKVQVINFSAAGRSSKSWADEGNLPKVLKEKPDYVLIQFGHNDQPGKGPARETDPATTYKSNLRMYVEQLRAVGAKPIIVSSVARRNFDTNGKIITSLTPWAESAESVAKELSVPFIDLHGLSTSYHNRVGSEISMSFNFKEGDKTHFNPIGARVIADLLLNELNVVVPELIKYRVK